MVFGIAIFPRASQRSSVAIPIPTSLATSFEFFEFIRYINYHISKKNATISTRNGTSLQSFVTSPCNFWRAMVSFEEFQVSPPSVDRQLR